MSNNNILEGMACPECGSEGPFAIQGSTSAMVSDNGIEPYGDFEYEGENFCSCQQCDFDGRVNDFTL